MLLEFKFRPVVALALALLIVFTGLPVSAAEILAPAATLGDIAGFGDIEVGGNSVLHDRLMDGDHVTTGDSSFAKITLQNGNRIEMSSRTILDVHRHLDDVQLRLTSGRVSFTALTSHLKISIGQYDILPEGNSSGRIASNEDGTASVMVEVGTVTLHDSDTQANTLLSGVAERIFQIAGNLPDASPQAPSQEPDHPAKLPPQSSPPNKPVGGGGGINKWILFGGIGAGGAAAVLIAASSNSTKDPLTILTSKLNTATVGAFYSDGLSAKGGQGEYTWQVSSGALPTSLVLDTSSGSISGVPSTSGTFDFTIMAKDSQGNSDSREFSIVVADAFIITSPSALPDGREASTYSQTLTVTGGTSPLIWSVGPGTTLPMGLLLDPFRGVLSGTPTVNGSFSFDVIVADKVGATATKNFTITIVASPITITSPSTLPGATAGAAYNQTLTAIGGTLPLTWSFAVNSSSITGLTYDGTTGKISGTPFGFGSSNFRVTVTDAAGAAQIKLFTIMLAAAPSVVGIGFDRWPLDANCSISNKAINGTAPLTWSISAGALPTGLSINAGTGEISGTPSVLGTFNFTMLVTDANKATASKASSIAITNSPLILTSPGLGFFDVNKPFSKVIQAVGTAPLTWSISGALPPGLSINAGDGTISGIPTQIGNFGFGVIVTDANNATDLRNFTVEFAGAPQNINAATVPEGSSTPSALTVTKDVDTSIVAPGDPVVFSLGITNTAQSLVSATTLNDILPQGFAFTSGSARLHILGISGEEVSTDSITPAVSSNLLTFPIGQMAPGTKVGITYSVVVKSDAHPGEARSSVVGIANLISGKRINSNTAQVKVTVTAGAFNLNQFLVGRVFDDRNHNGSFDPGEPGVANVRVVTSSGQTATTDSDGLYNIPSLSAGSVLVAIDAATLPPGFELPANESRLGGAGRILQTPLGGGGLLRQNFALMRTNTASNTTPVSEVIPSDANAAYGGPATKLEINIERAIMASGAYDRQLIRIRAADKFDHSTNTSLVVTTTIGSVMAAHRLSDQLACESVVSLDQRPDRIKQVVVDTDNGEAAICLISDVAPGTAHLTATGTGAAQASASADVRFQAASLAPLLVAVGELGVGLSRPGQNATDGARRVDGAASVFFQSSLTKKDLLTVAVRSKGSINSATGNTGVFEFDPTQSIYPVVGDASARQELGQSASRFHARYDRRQSFVMFGDLHGDTAAQGRSGLLEYNRNVTGIRYQIQTTNSTNWLQGQIARPRTGYMREISTALSGSAIHLARPQIVEGTESITLEVRDRRNPETIISRETLLRNVDYTLDSLSGTLLVIRSFGLFDSSLNLVQLVSTYEYQTTGVNATDFLTRGSYSVLGSGTRLGFSALSQDEGMSHFAIGGLEVEQKLINGGHFKAEVPISHGQLLRGADLSSGMSSDTGGARNGLAVRAEFDLPVGVRETTLHGRFSKTGEGFYNPYGTVTVQGQQSRGLSVETRAFRSGRFSLGIEQETNLNRAVDNERQTVSAKFIERFRENIELETGVDRRNYLDHRTGRQIDSSVLSAGLKWKPLNRLETSVSREQNLGDADPTYPTQTLLGAQFKVSETNRIFATQRLSSAPIIPITGAETSGLFAPRSTKETAIGVESRLYQNTSLTTNYRMDTSETGADSFAVIGVLTRLPVRPGLSLDWTLDNAAHLAGNGRGYVGASIGFTHTKVDKLQISARYEVRRSNMSQSLLIAGIAGRFTAATSAMARYRVSTNAGGTAGKLNDGGLALAYRPRKSDRVALLFSYDFGNGTRQSNMSPLSSTSSSLTNRSLAMSQETRPLTMAIPGRDRLSTDGLIDFSHGLEFYSRFAAVRTPDFYGGSRFGTYLQGRIQKSLTHRFDVAVEARWIRESAIVRGVLVSGVEWGTWIHHDFRIGLGYSSRGFANPGSLLNSTAARGGAYVVISSRLSSIFDLMGNSGKKSQANN